MNCEESAHWQANSKTAFITSAQKAYGSGTSTGSAAMHQAAKAHLPAAAAIASNGKTGELCPGLCVNGGRMYAIELEPTVK